ncbi:GntR family transcriptional regulator [Bacillaceae bacterium SIJ1]|uniref:GntR family transcriptional regulator n=1 Tax=Litoribacterium kuwaitense TaxID=1398745 RepID=UPI0013EA6FD0|nr:GntR family transcriptional regulator [Litoribacterium kuwaitense]NGP45665.1 GntR family transcriptional regulator [Litoribacterium kuwaitense]
MKSLQLHDKDSLYIKTCNTLRKAIFSGELQPGVKLTQDQLAKQLGISRMPIREALRQLENEGLVKVEPYRGAFVKELSLEDIEENYVLRSEMESLAIRKSLPYKTREDVKRLEELVREMDQTKSSEEFVELNKESHNLLLLRCPWSRLSKFIQTLWNGYPQHTPFFLQGQMEKSNQEHKEILLAIQAEDSEKAGRLIKEHISRTGKSLMTFIKTKNSR